MDFYKTAKLTKFISQNISPQQQKPIFGRGLSIEKTDAIERERSKTVKNSVEGMQELRSSKDTGGESEEFRKEELIEL